VNRTIAVILFFIIFYFLIIISYLLKVLLAMVGQQ